LKIEVHLKNGRTAFRFAKRSHLTRAMGQKPDHTDGRITAEIKHHPDEPEWRPTSVRFINPHSVSHVLEVVGEPVTGSAETAP